jgi:PRTRC genetic system protein A
MDPRDIVLQTVVPTVMVPRHSPIDEMPSNGHRFLMAGDGLWVEVKRSWLHLRLQLFHQDEIAMPYGLVTPVFEFAFERPPRHLVETFAAHAQKEWQVEQAAWIVRNTETGEFRLVMLESIDASGSHIHFHRPVLEEGEEMVIDLHSHGTFPAFFSGQDNLDDAGEVKISVVIGNCNQPQPSVAVRLCALGKYIPLPKPELFKEVIYA